MKLNLILRINLRVTAALLCMLWSAEVNSAPLVLNKDRVRIVVGNDESPAVKRAVYSLADDFGKVMGFVPEISDQPANRKGMVDLVIVNAAGESSPYSELPPLDGFESHRVYADKKANRIYLHGYDARGTIYAIYSFSENILGVPPLWYFCSWVPQTIKSVRVPDTYDLFYRSPQVRYRAWFPNDTDMFTPWKRLSRDNNERYLETMLRLKINTIELEASVSIEEAYQMSGLARLVSSYGLAITSHHHSPLNNTFSRWDDYWRNIRKMQPPALTLANMDRMVEFWRYGIETVYRNNVENLWLIAFRGNGDQPFWACFPDSPDTEEERAEVINRMIHVQYDLIREVTGDDHPYVRMTFYDEISDLLAKGWLRPPVDENMIWTYVAARRDHYPYTDIVNFDGSNRVKLGYYFNMQFTSTGSHLAQAEGPWKMEFNYRYVDSKGPLYFSVVNAGNIREHVMELSANAAMMWDMDAYDSSAFLLEFCKKYYGARHASAAADLYCDFYNSYWQQKEPDFEVPMERQYIFHDMRYGRVVTQLADRFADYSPMPLREIGFERLPGRTFRIDGENQVDSILEGMRWSIPRFEQVERDCAELISELPQEYRPFFYDNLYSQASFMANLSKMLYHFVYAYKHEKDREACFENLELAECYMTAARHALYANQHGVFRTWYDGDAAGVKFNMPLIQSRISKLKETYRGENSPAKKFNDSSDL